MSEPNPSYNRAFMENNEHYRTIPLTGKKGKGRYAKVSHEDYDRIMAFSRYWYLHSEGYAACKKKDPDGKWRPKYMHSIITGQPYSDHVNGDKLDNRRSNLFAGGASENMRNYSRKTPNSTSQYPGVCWDKQHKKWRAQITDKDGKYLHLGRFKNELDAAYAYYIRAIVLHPFMDFDVWHTPHFVLHKMLVKRLAESRTSP